MDWDRVLHRSRLIGIRVIALCYGLLSIYCLVIAGGLAYQLGTQPVSQGAAIIALVLVPLFVIIAGLIGLLGWGLWRLSEFARGLVIGIQILAILLALWGLVSFGEWVGVFFGVNIGIILYLFHPSIRAMFRARG